jgi:hypothetical protein
LRTLELVNGADMPDPVMAKLYKAIGRSFARKADDFDPAADNAPAGGKAAYIEAALTTLSRALVLDRNIGVKRISSGSSARGKPWPSRPPPPDSRSPTALGADGGPCSRFAAQPGQPSPPQNLQGTATMSTGVIAVPAAPWDPDDAQVVADGWFPPIKLATVRDSVRLGDGTISTERLTMAIEGAMLHAFRELATWRTPRPAPGWRSWPT